MMTIETDRVGDAGAAVDCLFHPTSVALIGASRAAGSRSDVVIRGLSQSPYRPRIHLVNPNVREIRGLPCYPSVEAIPDAIDVALIMLPTALAAGAVHESAAHGAKAAIVYGAVPGGLEDFNRGIASVVAATGIRVVGPNCVGLFNIIDGVPMGYGFPVVTNPVTAGHGVAIVGQSGGTLLSIASRATDLGVGLTHFASLGNEADLKFDDFLHYLLGHQDVQVVVAYLEQIRRPQRFIKLAEEARGKGRAIVALRVGKSTTAQRIAYTHTGAIVGSVKHEAAFFQELGVHLVGSVSEAAAVASALRSPAETVGGAGVITTTGGLSTTLADLALAYGVRLPELDASTYERIKSSIEPFHVQDSNVTNPLDLGAPGADNDEIWLSSFEQLIAQGSVAAGLAVMAPRQVTRARTAIDLACGRRKPVAFFLFVRDHAEADGLGAFAQFAIEGIPVFTSDSDSMRGIRAMLDSAAAELPIRFRAAAEAVEAGLEPDGVPPQLLGMPAVESTVKGWLSDEGIAVPAGRVVTSFEDAVAAAAQVTGFPLVLKVSDARVSHKTEVGGVATGIRNIAGLRRAWTAMNARMAGLKIHGVTGYLVEEQVPRGVAEWIVGAFNDFGFGPVVTVGTGGIAVEANPDVAIAPAPVDDDFAAKMITSLASWRLLSQRRLIAANDLEPLAKLVTCISRLAWACRQWLRAVDLNPVVLHAGRAVVLDARLDWSSDATSPLD